MNDKCKCTLSASVAHVDRCMQKMEHSTNQKTQYMLHGNITKLEIYTEVFLATMLW
jgi:hypothetical protein